jgi:hypothetical protein|nr:MAG TPA: hypothetical protein [Caudoviricetes sp.]
MTDSFKIFLALIISISLFLFFIFSLNDFIEFSNIKFTKNSIQINQNIEIYKDRIEITKIIYKQ